MTHNLTVTIDDKLWNEMQKHPEIRWSTVMKEAAEQRIQALDVLKRAVGRSRLSEEEIERISVELGRKIKGKAS